MDFLLTLFATILSTWDFYPLEPNYTLWRKCCPTTILQILSTCYTSSQVELELVCSTIPWPSPICPSNLGFEHSRLESVFVVQCLQELIVPFILNKFVPNMLWSFLIAYCTTPSCCNMESFVYVHSRDSSNHCRWKHPWVMNNHLTHDPWPRSSLGVVH